MIFVVATIQLVEGRREDFLAEFRKVVPTVRREEGCLDYHPTIDVPTNISAQVAERGDVVTVVEKWESLEALEAHLVAPHMNEYRGKVKPMVAGSSLQVLKPA